MAKKTCNYIKRDLYVILKETKKEYRAGLSSVRAKHVKRDLYTIPKETNICQKRPVYYTKRDQNIISKETYREYRAGLGSVRAKQVHKTVTVPQNPLRIAALASAVF